MQPHLQCSEGEGRAERDRELRVEYEPLVGERTQPGEHLWEVAGQGFAGFRSQLDAFAGAEYQTAESVPLRFELPAGLVRKIAFETGLHRLEAHGDLRVPHAFRSSRHTFIRGRRQCVSCRKTQASGTVCGSLERLQPCSGTSVSAETGSPGCIAVTRTGTDFAAGVLLRWSRWESASSGFVSG